MDDPFSVNPKTRFVGQERHDDLAEEADRGLPEVSDEGGLEFLLKIIAGQDPVQRDEGLDTATVGAHRAPRARNPALAEPC